MICRQCINDETVPGISFDEEGLCSFCNDYRDEKVLLEDYEKLEELWRAKLEALRGKGPYDAMLGLSGGKDSTYVLYQLVNTYGLKVKTFTLNNGFLTDFARQNVDKIVAELGVEHSYVDLPPQLMQPLYLTALSTKGAPCAGCAYAGYAYTATTATQLGIPLAVHGRSRSQMFQFLQKHSRDPFVHFIRAGLKEVTQETLRQTYRGILHTLGKNAPLGFVDKAKAFFPDFENPDVQLADFTAYFLYHEYDELRIVDFLEKNMNWRRPERYDILTHFDCSVHAAAGYLYELAECRPHIMPEISAMIRQGHITRKEGLGRLESERFHDRPGESLEILAQYVGKTPDELVGMARQLGTDMRDEMVDGKTGGG